MNEMECLPARFVNRDRARRRNPKHIQASSVTVERLRPLRIARS
jgi:hypothetical protein